MSAPYHSLELLPDEPGQEAVRRDWQRLRDAGLPSQLDHRGATNAPHLTLLAAPAIEAPTCERAVELVGPLLPSTVRAAGLVLFGGRRLTVARAVDIGDDLLAAVVGVRSTVAEHPHQGWIPHLTLARRLERPDVQRAVDVLGHEDVILRLDLLRRWDPTTRTVTVLATGRDAPGSERAEAEQRP